MPWRGVTVSEQRQRFLEDYQLNYYSVTELAERFGISKTTADNWINRFKEHGQSGFHEYSRRPHPGCPKSIPQWPNDICLHLRRRHRWAADYKGQFRLKNGGYCFPLTVSDLSSRYMLGCDAHPAISLEKSFKHFRQLFSADGLPNRILMDNGVPFASNALARLSQLSVWFIKLGIYPELPVLAD